MKITVVPAVGVTNALARQTYAAHIDARCVPDILNRQLASYKNLIRNTLQLSEGPVLINCEHGRSRSMALALILVYRENPDDVAEFLEQHPEAEPNPLLLLFGDEILGAGGDLLKRCSGRYKGRAL